MAVRRLPRGDVALLLATVAVGAWPLLGLATGAAPPAWELGTGLLFAMLAGRALLQG